MEYIPTLETTSRIVVALLIYVTSKPLIQGASKLTELAMYLFGATANPKKRNIIRSSEHSPHHKDIVVDTVVHDTLAIGLLLYLFGLSGADTLYVSSQNVSPGIQAAVLGFMASFSIFRALATMPSSATKSTLPVAHFLSWSSVIAAVTIAMLEAISLEKIMAIAIVSLFASQIITLTSRGIRNYGVFMIAWIPLAFFSWLCRVFSIAIFAPIIVPLFLLEIYLEHRNLTLAIAAGNGRTKKFNRKKSNPSPS